MALRVQRGIFAGVYLAVMSGCVGSYDCVEICESTLEVLVALPSEVAPSDPIAVQVCDADGYCMSARIVDRACEMDDSAAEPFQICREGDRLEIMRQRFLSRTDLTDFDPGPVSVVVSDASGAVVADRAGTPDVIEETRCGLRCPERTLTL